MDDSSVVSILVSVITIMLYFVLSMCNKIRKMSRLNLIRQKKIQVALLEYQLLISITERAAHTRLDMDIRHVVLDILLSDNNIADTCKPQMPSILDSDILEFVSSEKVKSVRSDSTREILSKKRKELEETINS